MALLWEDTFNRANATGVVAVNNGWAVTGGDINIVSNALERTGFNYLVQYNPASGSLPANLRVEADIIINGGEGATASYIGVCVKYNPATGDGIKALLEAWSPTVASNINIGSSVDPFVSETITLDTTLPVAGWSANGTHTLALEVTGSLCELYFDGLLVAHATYTPTTPGVNIGIVGDPGTAVVEIDAVRVHSLDDPITATLNLVLPSPAMALTADADINATLGLTLPVPPVLALSAGVVASGTLALTLPVPTMELSGSAPASGILDLILPVPALSFEAVEAALSANLREYIWNTLREDPILNSMGLNGDSIFGTQAPDSPAANLQKFMVIRWSLEDPRLGRDTDVRRRFLSIWAYDRRRNYTEVDVILQRARTILYPLKAINYNGNDGWILEVTDNGFSDDVWDDAYAAVARNWQLTITASGL